MTRSSPVAGVAPRGLVVDDNDLVRKLVSRVLEDGGLVVDAVATASEARRRPSGDYDVLIVDVRLGDERGTDLVEALRVDDPLVASRCLLLTGGLAEPLPADLPVLVKPFSADELLAAVRRLCPASRASRAT